MPAQAGSGIPWCDPAGRAGRFHDSALCPRCQTRLQEAGGHGRVGAVPTMVAATVGPSMLIGYLRVKAGDEDTRRAQRRALGDAGCGSLVEDPAAEGRCDQPELRRLLDELRPGDGIVVAQLDALGRSLSDLVRVLARIGAAGAACRSLQEAIDTTPPAGRAAGQLIGRLAAFERTMAGARIGLGLAAARAAGRGAGRPSKLTLRQRGAIAQEVLAGRRTAASMARLHQVSEARASADADGRDSIAGVLPLAALDERLAIVGTSGSGKTYAAKGLVERLIEEGARQRGAWIGRWC